MSRKTRKLIWSAPLLAALAVVGALAVFVALDPGSASADGLPGAPMNLTVEPADDDAGRTTLVLTWDAVANATGYRIDKSEKGFVWESLVMDTGDTRTTYMDDTLTAKDTRWYRVFAVNDHGVGPVSSPLSGTTDEKIQPGSVRNLRAVANGRNQIDLSWDPPMENGGKKIQGYEIQYHDGADWAALAAGSSPGSVTTTKMTEHQDKYDLDPGDTRIYRVRAVNGESFTVDANAMEAQEADRSENWTPYVRATTQPATAPGRVTGLTAVNISDTQIELYWYAPADKGGEEITHYLIQARRPGQTWPTIPSDDNLLTLPVQSAPTVGSTDDAEDRNILIAVPVADARQATITAEKVDHDEDEGTLAKQVRWDFRVYAVTTGEGLGDEDVLRRSAWPSETASATAVARPPSGDPHASPDVMATGKGGPNSADAAVKQIDLTIVSPTEGVNQNAYRIDYSDDAGKTWKSLVRDTRFTSFGEARVYEDVMGLGYDQKRSYRVFTIGTNWRTGVGPATDIIPGSTGPSEAPGKVTGVMATAPDLKTIEASWTAPEDDGGQPIVSYLYRYVKDADEDGVADDQDWVDDSLVMSASTGTAVPMHTIEVSAGLAEETLYHIQIAAQNNDIAAQNEDPDAGEVLRPASARADNVMWSDAASFETGAAMAPMAVEGLTSQVAVDTSGDVAGVLLLWNKPSSGAAVESYEVERKVDDGEWEHPTSDAEESTMDRTSFTDPNEPEAGEMRTYRVRAVNTAGESDWVMVYYPRDPASDHSHVVDLTAPTGVRVSVDDTDPGEADLTVTWTPGENAVGHMVLVFTSDFSAVPYLDAAPGEGSSTIEDVADGSYVVVVVSYKSDTEYLYDHVTVSVGQ